MSTSFSKVCKLGLYALIAACLGAAPLDAQTPGAKKGKGAKGPEGPAPDADILTVRGVVREFTSAPKGEVDGVMLTDGTWAHWPPYLADRFRNIVSKGDKVKVVGWMETGKKGETKLEVSSLTNLNTNETRANDRFPPSAIEAAAGIGSATGNALTVNGSVREFTTAKKGEVDGFILSDGKWIHWPPHLASRFSDFVVKGDKVRVTGSMETGKKGENKFEVSTLTNLRTNRTIENPERPPPAAENLPAPRAMDREDRLRALEDQVEQILREIQRLRKKR
ncbi:MAG TPA: hypothetical protein VNX28_13450 [Gemmataceae bacterium]|nr:hypothetical protein [Gemmataceae bacterium]